MAAPAYCPTHIQLQLFSNHFLSTFSIAKTAVVEMVVVSAILTCGCCITAITLGQINLGHGILGYNTINACNIIYGLLKNTCTYTVRVILINVLCQLQFTMTILFNVQLSYG